MIRLRISRDPADYRVGPPSERAQTVAAVGLLLLVFAVSTLVILALFKPWNGGRPLLNAITIWAAIAIVARLLQAMLDRRASARG